MLFLPLIDKHWHPAGITSYKYQRILWLLSTGAVLLILIANPDQAGLIIYILILVALPEEWFFRVYFMMRLEEICDNKFAANVTTSALFAVLHLPVQGWFGLTVFIPSILFGWIYQRRQDMFLIVILHALSNLVYLLYLEEIMYNLQWS